MNCVASYVQGTCLVSEGHCSVQGAFLLASDDARAWANSDQDPALNSDSSEEEDDEGMLGLDMMGAGESSEQDDEMDDVLDENTESEKGGLSGAVEKALQGKNGMKSKVLAGKAENVRESRQSPWKGRPRFCQGVHLQPWTPA